MSDTDPIVVTLDGDDTASYAVHVSPQDVGFARFIVRHAHHNYGTVRKEVWAARLGRQPGPKLRRVFAKAGFTQNDNGQWRRW